METAGDDLVSEYAAALPHRVEAIVELIQQARAAAWTGGMREQVRHLAHQLSGSALTYGFHDVGQAVRRIEVLVAAASVGEPAFDALLDIAVERLKGVVAYAARGRAPVGPALAHGRLEAGGRQPVVMLVDDDTALTALLARQLQGLGFAAHAFSDGDTALAAAHRLQPQVLLMDVMFPGAGDAGFDLGTQLAARLEHPPVMIFMTGRDDIEARRRAASAGALSFLTKPVNLHALAAILEHRFAANRRSQPRVLLVEDSVPIARMYTLYFERVGLQARAVSDPLQLFDAIYEFQPDLVFLDLGLQDIDGAELCQLLRQHETLFDLPVIGLTGETDPAALKRAMQAGMDGILRKDNDLAGLLPLIRERTERHRRIRHSMSRDLLTGLLNRGALLERLENELMRAQRLGQTLSLAIVDIDRFRQVNDGSGHLAGDDALRRVAREIQGRLRATDFAGRLGGDEFVVVLPNATLEGAVPVLEEIVARVRRSAPEQDGQPLRLTLSIGLVDSRVARDAGAHAVSVLMTRADGLLYEAKQQGGDRVAAQL